MFTQMSMLMGCCRERHLTRIDPNVEDENVSWVCTARANSNVREWRNANGVVADTLYAQPRSGYFIVDDSTPFPYNGYGHPASMSGAGFMTGPSKTSGRTSELYLRAIVHFNRSNTGICHIASIMGPDGSVVFSLTGQASGANGWLITAKWTDIENKTQSMQTYSGGPSQKDWIDVKVFIPASGAAKISSTAVINTSYNHTEENTKATKGFKDNLGDQLYVFSSGGPQAQWHDGYRIYRVGIGNRISTALP